MILPTVYTNWNNWYELDEQETTGMWKALNERFIF